jgi:hypothetical protein
LAYEAARISGGIAPALRIIETAAHLDGELKAICGGDERAAWRHHLSHAACKLGLQEPLPALRLLAPWVRKQAGHRD